jgi:hypothetical protein
MLISDTDSAALGSGSDKVFTHEERGKWLCRECTNKTGPIWLPPVLTLITIVCFLGAKDPLKVTNISSAHNACNLAEPGHRRLGDCFI